MKSLFTKLCKVFFLLRLCIISGFAQSKVDTIFLNDLPLYNFSTEYHKPYFTHMQKLHPSLYKKSKFRPFEAIIEWTIRLTASFSVIIIFLI